MAEAMKPTEHGPMSYAASSPPIVNQYRGDRDDLADLVRMQQQLSFPDLGRSAIPTQGD